MTSIPPTRGSLRCMCWQGYKGDTWEDYAEKQRQDATRLPPPETVVKRVQKCPGCGRRRVPCDCWDDEGDDE